MSVWSTYEARLGASNNTAGDPKRSFALDHAQGRISRKITASLSYETVKINGKDKQVSIGDVTGDFTTKKIFSLPGETLPHGELIEWEGSRWLVTEVDAHHALYAEGVMRRCNYYLTALTEVLSKLQSAYSALESAEQDMATGQGLTAETIAALAAAEENYLDYLYEENGVVMLNTEAWRENANAKMLLEMAEIESEISSLEEQNQLIVEQNKKLEQNIEYYKEQREFGSDGGMWNQLIAEATGEIESNNEAIEQNSDLIRENQGLLAVYGALYNGIAEDATAYNKALSNFSNIANTIDSVAASYWRTS